MTTEDEILLDYTARDFEAIRSMLVGIARGKFPEWRTVGEANDFGTLLLELYAYMGDVSNFYVDRVSAEAFLGTAQRRQSVLYIAEMLGYRPLPRHAATVPLTFSLSPDYPDEVLSIPSGTLVETRSDAETEDSIFFETDYTVTVEAGQSVEMTATEGRSASQFLGVSKGTPNSGYATNEKGVIGGTVRVRTLEGRTTTGVIVSPQYVNWQEVNSVAGARPTQSVFSTYTDDEDYTVVVFGDNSAGRIPPVGAEMEINYRYGVGAAARSVNPNEVTVITNTSLPVGYLTVTNKSSPVGGADPESVESMRFAIPRARQVRYRGVTLEDFQSLTLQVPGVSKAVAYGEVYSAVNLRIAPSDGDDSPERMIPLRSAVRTYLADKLLIGAEVYVENVEWEDVYLDVNVTVLDGFSQDGTVASVYTSIQDLFSYFNLDFGQGVSLGEVYRAAWRVDGVDFVTISAYNTAGLDDSTTRVRIVPQFSKIIRIHPMGEDPEADPYGLQVTGSGGVE